MSAWFSSRSGDCCPGGVASQSQGAVWATGQGGACLGRGLTLPTLWLTLVCTATLAWTALTGSLAEAQNRDAGAVVPPEEQRRAGSQTAPIAPGTAVAVLSAGLTLLQPDALHPHADPGLSLALQVVARPESWPVMVGLKVAADVLAAGSQPGPWAGTRIHRNREILQVDLLCRYQPLWGPLRPFIEGVGGLALLSESRSLNKHFSGNLWQVLFSTQESDPVLQRETVNSYGLLYGASLGVDIPLNGTEPGEGRRVVWVLSLGVSYWRTTPMTRAAYSTGLPLGRARAGPLAAWNSFVGIGLAFDSRRGR